MKIFRDQILSARQLVNAGFKYTGSNYGGDEDEGVWRFFANKKRTLLLEDLGQSQYRFILET